MRLWSLHPRYLDAKGLVALWREALLAQKVLAGNTKGYRNHPQLDRFKRCSDPLAAMAAYLDAVAHEAVRRGYRFDAAKIMPHGPVRKLTVTSGQLAYELEHLRAKLQRRDAAAFEKLHAVERASVHPLFRVVSGDVEDWEVR
jgi:Pyrimidine dimer DNA glycosylase